MDPKQNPEADSDKDQPIAWRAVPEDTAVRSEGQQIGALYDLLGSHEEDIFHGIVVQLRSGSRRVFIPADDVALITASHVDVSLSANEIAALPEPWRGVFRGSVESDLGGGKASSKARRLGEGEVPLRQLAEGRQLGWHSHSRLIAPAATHIGSPTP